jgi:hypothetical protein
MMETVEISETSVFNSAFTRLISRENVGIVEMCLIEFLRPMCGTRCAQERTVNMTAADETRI